MHSYATKSTTAGLSAQFGVSYTHSYRIPKNDIATPVVMPISSLNAVPIKIVYVGAPGDAVRPVADPTSVRHF